MPIYDPALEPIPPPDGLQVYTCKRCGYRWATRRPDRPIRCARHNCRSPYWDKRKPWPPSIEEVEHHA